MWIYLVITIVTNTYDVTITCPNGVSKCASYHFKTVEETVKRDTAFFCEKKDAVFRYKWLSYSSGYSDGSMSESKSRKLDSIWVNK